MFADLKLTTVIVTALVDSINPCAIGVLVLLISTLLSLYERKKRMLLVGIIYISTVYITYFVAGIGLLAIIHKLQINQMIGIMVAFLVIFLGFVDIKDFFFEGKGFSLTIPPSQVKKIKKYADQATVPAIIILGFIVAAVELPCTGGPYLAITTILAGQLNFMALLYLALYNLIFVLPLIIILFLAYFGSTALHINTWKNKYKKWMRLASGLLMVGLGVLLILFARGVILL